MVPVRVVLDSNVALSALLFRRGRLAQLREAWHQERFIPLVAAVTAAELLRVLGYPKLRLTATDQQELVADFLPYCAVVRVPARVPGLPACRDPLDMPFLKLAAVGKAGFLVSGDQDLLAIRSHLSFRIVKPLDCLNALGME